MFKHLGILTAAIVISACTQSSAAPANSGKTPPPLASVLMDKTEGCMNGPVAQFGQYIGDWKIQDWSVDKAGVWTEGKGARWNFTCVGNGIAVQDFWMPAPGRAGTNLRIYDPKSESWKIAWTANGAPGFSQLSAKQNEAGAIVMHYVTPKTSPPRRITFFPPTNEGWDWVQEMSFDNEKTWRPVYKIKASRLK